MKIDIYDFNGVHLLGEIATRPIALLATRLGCCSSLQAVACRRRLAYPNAPSAAYSGVFN